MGVCCGSHPEPEFSGEFSYPSTLPRGLGREGRLTAEERAHGRVDAGQRLAQHDGRGALRRTVKITDGSGRLGADRPPG